MNVRRMTMTVLVALACAAAPAAQAPRSDEDAWQAFIAWFKAAPPARTSPFTEYANVLKTSGLADEEVRRQLRQLVAIMSTRNDWVELFYDKTFTRPATGDPASDGYATAPSRLLADAVAGLTPGTALDAGMGQGRNAVYLARQGWKVTGLDLSGEAIKAALANARASGVSLETVKASYGEFDFGTARWDLIVLVFAWAPVDDPAFVERLRAGLRPGGRIVFEHFIDEPGQARPAAMHALKPGQLRAALAGFRLDRYEELVDLGDWGGPDSRLVRAVAVRQQP